MPLAKQSLEAARPTQALEISAGPVSVSLGPTGAALRDVAFDGEVVLRGLAFVARDANWGTLPLTAPPQVRPTGNGVEIEARGSGMHANGDLSWHVLFRIAPNGVEARSTVRSSHGFRTNRTGLVVLHGLAACRGQEAVITHPNGQATRAEFPVQVSPHQPFMDVSSIAHRTARGASVRIDFEGEVFETEDQRNWTDASYKTYSRPLARPFPYMIGAGETVEQVVRITFEPGVSASSSIEVNPQLGCKTPMPHLGAGCPVTRPVADERIQAPLAGLGLDSVAFEIDPEEDDWAEALATHLAAWPGRIRLDCRLHGGVDPKAVLERISKVLAGRKPVGISLWGADRSAVEIGRRLWPDTPVGGGTGAFFAEFNRGSLPPGIDYATWTTNPTVHASDDDTIGESIEPLGDILATAKAKAPGRDLVIGPLTLVMRFNPNATSAEARRAEPPADPRQNTMIAASWLLGTIAGFLDPSVRHLTIFEVAGPKGLIQADGAVSPAAQLVARLAPLAGCPAQFVTWPGKPRARGLLVDTPNGRVLAVTHARATPVRLPLPEGRWSAHEHLGPRGFAMRPQQEPGDIEVDGFGVAWLSEAS